MHIRQIILYTFMPLTTFFFFYPMTSIQWILIFFFITLVELIVRCANAGGFLAFPCKGLQARVRCLARPTWKVGRGSGVKGRDLGATP